MNIKTPPAEFKNILEGLHTLSRNQLEQLKVRCGILLQNRRRPSVEPIEDEDWLLHGVFVELVRRGLEDGERAAQFSIRKWSSFGGYEEKARIVRNLLEQAAPGLNLTERRYLGEVAAHELARYMDTWKKVDVSRDTLLQYIDRVPVALERAFPGMLASRMLAVVIQHKF